MKALPWIISTLAILSACSPKSDTPIGNADSFSFEVPTNTPVDSLNSAIGREFLKRYALLDTSMIVQGNVIAANILAYDSTTEFTKCVQGYLMFVTEDPKAHLRPTFNGDYFGRPRKLFFFTGSNNHFEVWNRPVVTHGTDEDGTETADVILEYKATAECAFLGLKTSRPILTVGLEADEKITFYYWSELSHRLEPVVRFMTAYSMKTVAGVTTAGKIATMAPGELGVSGIEYTVSGDSNYIERYVWRPGKFVKYNHFEDQSRFDLQVEEMGDVGYPVFKSNKRLKAAESINKALQMLDFGELVNGNSYDRLLKPHDEGEDPDKWSFRVKRIGNNVIHVSTLKIKFGAKSEELSYHQHYFNAHTGDPIPASDLIQPGSEKAFGDMAIAALDKSLANQKKDASFDYKESGGAADQVFMSWDLKTQMLMVETPAYSEDYYDMVQAEIPLSEFTMGTDYLDYLMGDDEILDPPNTFARVWHGSIAGETPVTFVFWGDEQNMKGYIVYDANGKGLPFRATKTFDGRYSGINVEQLDDSNNVTATFTLKAIDTKLQGTYKTADGTEKPFEAVTGAWEK